MPGSVLKLFRRRPVKIQPGGSAQRAGRLFDQRQNCAQAVLQATTGRQEPAMLGMLEGFRGGIGDTGCLCGAIVGGVMALGLSGRSQKADRLIRKFTENFGTTFCRGLSSNYRWFSKEHLANCRQITVKPHRSSKACKTNKRGPFGSSPDAAKLR